jgi:CSLREA domain-containing protein
MGALADTFKPTRFDDPAPNKCKPHDCSLREAIRAADKDPSHSTILLGKGTYKLQIPPDRV